MTLCPRINIRDLDGLSLMATYEKDYNLELVNVERTLGNTILRPKEKKNFFGNEIPLAVFVLDGAVFFKNDEIVEIEHSYYRGDKYKFSVTAKPQFTFEKGNSTNLALL